MVQSRRLINLRGGGCAGVGWDRVNFLTVAGMRLVWICAENSAYNAKMFFVVEQCLHSDKAFSAPPPTPPARLGTMDFLTFPLPVISHVLPGVSEQVMLSCSWG